MMDPNHFLMIMLSRFELYQIFSTPDYGKRFSTENTNKVFYVHFLWKNLQNCFQKYAEGFCATSVQFLPKNSRVILTSSEIHKYFTCQNDKCQKLLHNFCIVQEV